jgi:hypothetical protein
MKFPGGGGLHRIRRVLFPTAAELQTAHEARLAAITAEAEAEIAARRSAQEAAAYELRLGCAERLRPYIGRLILVNNFKGIGPEENAARVSRAVVTTASFGTDAPIGISTILSYGRGNHDTLVETADALRISFEGIGQLVFSVPPQRGSSDLWLLSLARAAEDTARQSDLPPDKVGCIAVASALDMNRQVDIPWVPAPGAAFRLTDISEGAHFGWEMVSVHPIDEQQAAFQEGIRRLPDLGNFQ